ncbi:hypothetical protein JCGZ_04687 [Jatropha curcas]|uniref:Uncharacterized protein n=1 Tax=Jatropha curcas TaxID=180498 RepID=A0A067L1R7_JATCU|nr:hypothetical protein JCGZ_04687 [Jatropha curcas]
MSPLMERLRFVFVVLVLVLVMATIGASSRPIKGLEFSYLFENRFPRGPVPPSGPSPCHNKFILNTSDYVMCP